MGISYEEEPDKVFEGMSVITLAYGENQRRFVSNSKGMSNEIYKAAQWGYLQGIKEGKSQWHLGEEAKDA